MDILLLCVSAILIARFADKRSSAVTVAHSVLFVVLLFFMCFTTTFPPVQNMLLELCGDNVYRCIHAVVSTPCIWVYSASAVIYVVEIILIAIVAIGAAVHVANKLLSKKKPFEQKASSGSETLPASYRVLDAVRSRIYLKYCRLLN